MVPKLRYQFSGVVFALLFRGSPGEKGEKQCQRTAQQYSRRDETQGQTFTVRGGHVHLRWISLMGFSAANLESLEWQGMAFS